jgi:hypothetical protein
VKERRDSNKDQIDGEQKHSEIFGDVHESLLRQTPRVCTLKITTNRHESRNPILRTTDYTDYTDSSFTHSIIPLSFACHAVSGSCRTEAGHFWASVTSASSVVVRLHAKAGCAKADWWLNLGEPMDASLLEELTASNKPFKIETASGRLFEVPRRDFVSFSTRKTSVIVSYEENGAEHFAIVPLLPITAAMARA